MITRQSLEIVGCQSFEYIQLLSGWRKTLRGARDYKPRWRWWIIPDLMDRYSWSPSTRRWEPDNIHKSDKMPSAVPTIISIDRDDESYQIWQTDVCNQSIPGSRNLTISVIQLVKDQAARLIYKSCVCVPEWCISTIRRRTVIKDTQHHVWWRRWILPRRPEWWRSVPWYQNVVARWANSGVLMMESLAAVLAAIVWKKQGSTKSKKGRTYHASKQPI